jgi:hypothetical protein
MRPVPRLLALASTLALTLATSALSAPAPAVPVGVSPIKWAQRQRMVMEPMRERREAIARHERLRRLARKLHASGKAAMRFEGERSRPELLDEDARMGRTLAPAGKPLATNAPLGIAALSNVRCNDPSGDMLSPGFGSSVVEGQCETSIVRWNNDLVAAWNDGKGYDDGTNQTQGWATSVDGGATWVDHGTFPVPAAYPGWTWASDPVLAVNPNTGAFYFSALGDAPGPISSIGVIKGRFSGSSFTWGPVSPCRITNATQDPLDKEWIAVDPADGRVHISYSDFSGGTTSLIEYQFSDSSLTTWSPVKQISLPSENGWVQGSRPVVGAGANVYVVYYLIGPTDVDYFRIATSTNRGQSFSAPNTAVSFYPNFGTGAPGFNRPMGIQFPSVAVDHSNGAHDGRIFLTWAESLNWIDDLGTVGAGTDKSEVEPNDNAANATPTTAGMVLRGTTSGSSASSDLDYYSVPLLAGQTIIVAVDSLASGLGITLRMYAADGATRLAFLSATSSDVASYGAQQWIYTAPVSGTYYVRVAGYTGGGAYRVKTGLATRTTERGRDQRDVFTSYSDNGVTWSSPVRVNTEAVGYDDWLPEIAVAPDGQVACAWYDWRDATAATDGGESSIYLATSDDGGSTWTEKGAVSDTRTAWTSVQTNIAPNQGDYLSLYEAYEGLAVAWSDGRNGNPDVYMQWLSSDRPVATYAHGAVGRVDLQWFMNRAPGTTAALYRQVGASGTWDSLATLTLDAQQHLSYTDTTGITAGMTYRYELGVVTTGTEHIYPYLSVTIPPPGLQLAGAFPNPAHQDATIQFTLPTSAPAKLTLVDTGGRRVYSLPVSGAGVHVMPLVQDKRIDPGVYFIKLEQSGKKATKRIVVV